MVLGILYSRTVNELLKEWVHVFNYSTWDGYAIPNTAPAW